jgi:hypothetical protein
MISQNTILKVELHPHPMPRAYITGVYIEPHIDIHRLLQEDQALATHNDFGAVPRYIPLWILPYHELITHISANMGAASCLIYARDIISVNLSPEDTT